MKLRLIAQSHNIETMIAVSMLTTTSGAMPSTLYNRLLAKPAKVQEIIGRVEVQHGTILEHNRLVWRLEATRDEILTLALRSKFFNISESENDIWVLSGNLRALVEYQKTYHDDLSEQLVESIREAVPNIYGFIRRNNR